MAQQELDRLGVARLALDQLGAMPDVFPDPQIVNSQTHHVTVKKLAVDRQIEQGKVAFAIRELKVDADRTDFASLQRRFLADQFAFVPGFWA